MRINCDYCDSDGYTVISCCGDDIKGNDIDLCPTCYEHCGMEEEQCEECCEHENKTYQAEEKDTNVGESYTCEDCGADLDIPEPDWDAMAKEDRM